MTSWNHQVIKGQWRYTTRKWFFEFLAPNNYPWAFKNHRIVFYSSHGTRWTLKFCSSSVRGKVIGDHGFRYFSALDLTSEVTSWPRTLSLYINSSSRGELHARFFRETLAQSGAKRQGESYQPPLCRGRMRNGLCRRGLTRALLGLVRTLPSAGGGGAVSAPHLSRKPTDVGEKFQTAMERPGRNLSDKV